MYDIIFMEATNGSFLQTGHCKRSITFLPGDMAYPAYSLKHVPYIKYHKSQGPHSTELSHGGAWLHWPKGAVSSLFTEVSEVVKITCLSNNYFLKFIFSIIWTTPADLPSWNLCSCHSRHLRDAAKESLCAGDIIQGLGFKSVFTSKSSVLQCILFLYLILFH